MKVDLQARKPPAGAAANATRHFARPSVTLLRLLACAANAVVWMVACWALDAGLLATMFAGIIGFLAVAMIVGAVHEPYDWR